MGHEVLKQPEEFTKQMLKALCFEQYLRFFFLDIPSDDVDSSAVLHVSDDIVKDIEQKYPELMMLLNTMQNKSITFEQSRSAVIDQVAKLLGVEPNDAEYRSVASEISQSDEFQETLLDFHSWVQEMDELIDYSEPISFDAWFSNYQKWSAENSEKN